jgi:Fe-S cluster assembly scaffold protein SufB
MHKLIHRDELKRKEKLESRKKDLMSTSEALIPKWTSSSQPFYDQSNFAYYEKEGEEDDECLNDIAKALGLDGNM